ncbi:hypothetical protein [Kitasatospora sp. NPDC058190]|uniref:hypothetical protein n=1 Tax=Kitasatospora sp. NPDC058190 TaxID=3346371 RepID=UPI0036DF5FD9
MSVARHGQRGAVRTACPILPGRQAFVAGPVAAVLPVPTTRELVAALVSASGGPWWESRLLHAKLGPMKGAQRVSRAAVPLYRCAGQWARHGMLPRMIDTPDSGTSGETWSFATAREPAEFPAVEVEGVPGVEHAGGRGRTLCGIRSRYLKLFLHHFQPQALASCRKCRALAEAAPSRPCGQERLHNLLLREADDGRLRTDLLAALRRGARIAIWITGPAKDLARSHSRIDRMTEEAGPAAETLAAASASITLARIEDADRQYLVVLPPDGRARIARGVVTAPPAAY